jgi:hypothetical protein
MSNTTLPNNPAGRLLEICRTFRKKQDSTQVRDIWSEITGVPKTDMATLLARVGVALSLIDATRTSIRRIEGISHDLFLQWEAPVSAGLGKLNFDDGYNIAETRRLINEAVIARLEFCDHELSRHSKEPRITQEELDGILADLKKLGSDVLAADFPPDVKAFFVDKIDLLERAILLLRFNGVGRLCRKPLLFGAC